MSRVLHFAGFRLDPSSGRLLHLEEPKELTPKAFSLLHYLASHPEQLISKDQLLNAVWGDAFVGEAVLKVAIAELRKVLGDDPKEPEFIQTVHRRGYRFIGQPSKAQRTSGLLGRDASLAKLNQSLREAFAGERQMIFITGEPGIGKSALLEAFLESVPGHVLIARGQSLEKFGESEPYLPVMDALGRLTRSSAPEFLPILRRHAPTWLSQMPSVVPEQDRESLAREVLGATRERMLREVAEALEVLSAGRPVILALEDLHWADLSTVDLVSALAWRTAPAQLVVIGTYRPVEVIVQDHPIKSLKQELVLQGRASEIALEFLSEAEVADFVGHRFPQHSFPRELPNWLCARTGGNPLFLINLLDFVVHTRGNRWTLRAPLSEIASEVPDSLRQMIGKQIERLDAADQDMLEAAAVAGMEFAVIAVAAAMDQDPVTIEERCQRLARSGLFLVSRGAGELPDGSVSERFRFAHALYQAVLYQRIGLARRTRLHQRIGEKGEKVYGKRAGEIAAELAMQFESARDYRAVTYLRQASQNAIRRYANREAVDFLTRALAAADVFPEPERGHTEWQLLEERGFAYRSMGLMREAANDFARAADRARAQSDAAGEVKALLFQVSAVSWLDHEECIRLADHAVTLCAGIDDDLLHAHARGYCSYWHMVLKGWRPQDVRAARETVQAIRASGDAALLAMHVSRLSFFESLSSDYEQAVRLADEGTVLSLADGDPFEYILAQYFRIWALFFGGHWGDAYAALEEAIALANCNGHRQWVVLFRLQLMWLYLELEEFETATAIGVEALDAAVAAEHPLSRLIASLLLCHARLGCGDIGSAGPCFEAVDDWLARERILMDWIWRLPLCLGRAKYAFARQDFVAARDWSRYLIELAGRPGERTWLARGELELARIAAVLGSPAEFTAHLDAALTHAANAPLAAYAVYQFAGDSAAATRSLDSLLESIPAGDPLRSARLFRARSATGPVNEESSAAGASA